MGNKYSRLKNGRGTITVVLLVSGYSRTSTQMDTAKAHTQYADVSQQQSFCVHSIGYFRDVRKAVLLYLLYIQFAKILQIFEKPKPLLNILRTHNVSIYF